MKRYIYSLYQTYIMCLDWMYLQRIFFDKLIPNPKVQNVIGNRFDF